MLGAGEKRANGSGIDSERGGEFVVVEALAPKKQKLRLPAGDGRQNRANPRLLLFRGERAFGSRRGSQGVQQTLEPLAPSLAAEFVQRHARSGAIEPGFCAGSVGRAVARPLQKYFHCDLFRAARILDDADNGAGNMPVVGMEDGFEIGRSFAGGAFDQRIV